MKYVSINFNSKSKKLPKKKKEEEEEEEERTWPAVCHGLLLHSSRRPWGRDCRFHTSILTQCLFKSLVSVVLVNTGHNGVHKHFGEIARNNWLSDNVTCAQR